MTDEEPSEGVRPEDTGLPVINEEEEEIGVIDNVMDEYVTIDPAETLDEDTRTALEWEDPDALQTLPRSMLERVSHDTDTESYVKVFRFDTNEPE